jgi:antitoxin YefM
MEPQFVRPPFAMTYAITYALASMPTITASAARASLYKLVDQAAETHEPVQIVGKRHNAVLVSEEDWRAIQETLYLLSIPGMRESIVKGMKTPLSRTSKTLKW